MSFTDAAFYIFFAVLFCVMLFIESAAGKRLFKDRQQTAQKLTLLAASYIFYGYWNYKFCFLLFALSAVVFFCAKKINTGKIYTFLGIGVPIIVLGIFKYFNFFVESFCEAFKIQAEGALSIILPVGISFYTFQSLSYIIDVKRKSIKAEKSFLNLALYIAFFPQLVAGPIVKAADFLPQLKENRRITKSGIEAGIQIFVYGLFKKIVLADNLSVFVDDVFERTAIYSGVSVLLGVIAYSLQIYFDFSGYSDMAIGCAKIFGYDFNKNFDLPYVSKNVSEFWKRWHISLSSWLQSYLYIPLGGNRKGNARTYLNLMITMLLGGLWHGANWTFVAWGALHGVALCVHKSFRRIMYEKKNSKGTFIGNAASTLITYLFVCFCWIFFRADSFSQAFDIIKAIFTMQKGINFPYAWLIASVVLLCLATLYSIIKNKTPKAFYPCLKLDKISGLTVFIVFTGLTVIFAYTGANPFVYFQF